MHLVMYINMNQKNSPKFCWGGNSGVNQGGHHLDSTHLCTVCTSYQEVNIDREYMGPLWETENLGQPIIPLGTIIIVKPQHRICATVAKQILKQLSYPSLPGSTYQSWHCKWSQIRILQGHPNEKVSTRSFRATRTRPSLFRWSESRITANQRDIK